MDSKTKWVSDYGKKNGSLDERIEKSEKAVKIVRMKYDKALGGLEKLGANRK